MSTSDRLIAIARERYETGAHGNSFLMMSKATMDTIPRPEPRPYESTVGAMMRLWDIPIILDAALPAGAWRLIDRTTGAEIESEGVPMAREGWAQAIEALRAEAAKLQADADYDELRGRNIDAKNNREDAVRLSFAAARLGWLSPALTDRAAALTEEGGQ